ncbi:MAG: hypothetical protein RI979_2343 [Pseudomonadota bacterium]
MTVSPKVSTGFFTDTLAARDPEIFAPSPPATPRFSGL